MVSFKAKEDSNMMKVEEISVRYQEREILKNISFICENNEMIFLFGENGVGKTTFLKSVLGLLPIKSGKIEIDGKNLESLTHKERAHYISYVSQTKDIVHTTCFDFILTGVNATLSIFDTPSSKQKEKVIQVMDEMNILSFKDTYMDEISGGERQLMYIARAFVQDASYILLDEPCAYLDYDKQHRILKFIQEYVQKYKKTAFITTHDPNLALRYATRILVIDKGRLCLDINANEENAKEQFLNQLNVLYNNHLDLSDHKYIYYKGDE